MAIFIIEVFFQSCTHAPSGKYITFKNPESEKKVNKLRKLLTINPNNVEKRIELGRIFLSEDMPQEAITELKKALMIDPENIKALLLLSLAFQKLPEPDFNKALEILKKASLIEPNNAYVHLNLAYIYDSLKNEKNTIQEFNQAIKLSNDPAILVSAHLGLMAIYKRQGDLEKANKEYEAAYEIYPDIKDILKEQDIYRITPPPKYDTLRYNGKGLHPSIEKRIKHARKVIEKLNRK